MSTFLNHATSRKLSVVSGLAMMVAIAGATSAEVRGDAGVAKPGIIAPGIIEPSLAGLLPAAERAFGEAPVSFKIAGKIGAAVTGAAVVSRATRKTDGEKKDDTSAAADAPAAHAESETAPSGPFKIEVPGQSNDPVYIEKSKPAAPRPAKTAEPKANSPAVDKGPIRTVFEEGKNAPAAAVAVTPKADQPTGKNSPANGLVEEPLQAATTPPAAATVAAQAAAPASAPAAAASANGGSCIAGCYTITSARAASNPVPAVVRPAPPAAKAEPTGMVCIAGCGDSKPAPRISTPSADAPAATEGAGRITVLRGVTRTRAYGTGN